MYKNQLQELAQRSCFNLPSYTSFREGPDHAPRFKSTVNFNGETFASPNYCSTLRQAEHSAAEVALNALSCHGPSNSLAVRVLEETGVYKNLLQEVSQKAGASLPAYTTFRSGTGHLPSFTCTVELAGVVFTGEPAKNKKQAEKSAAMSAWFSLKSLVQQSESSSSSDKPHKDELEHVVVARSLQRYIVKARLAGLSFPIKFPSVNPRKSTPQHAPAATSSKILPFISPTSSSRSTSIYENPVKTTRNLHASHSSFLQKFPAAGAAPYIPVSHCYPSHSVVAPPVAIRNSVPVFSPPPFPSPQSPVAIRPQSLHSAPPVTVTVFAAHHPFVKVEDPRIFRPMVSRAAQNNLRGSLFSKMPTVRVQEPNGPKMGPVSVVPKLEATSSGVKKPNPEAKNQVEPIIPMITDDVGSVKVSAAEELQALKDLKM